MGARGATGAVTFRARGPVLVAALASLAGACEGPPIDHAHEAADCAAAQGAALAGGPHLVALNAYYLQEEAARAVRRGDSEAAAVEETLAKAAALGVRTVRTNGFNDDPAKRGDSAIQVAKLTYDEVSWRGLDLVLARARAHGVRLVLTLGNYWDAYGGARQYVAWAGRPRPVEGDARFFTDRAVVEHYKAHVARVLGRVSTVDGLRYGEHPAVLAWELLNEPRGDGLAEGGLQMRAWVDELAAHVKRLAPSHLVGTGEEGFDTSFEGDSREFWEDLPSWIEFEGGSSFRLNTASPHVDFASVHLYPDAWGVDADRAAAMGARWIAEHAAIARSLGKPLVVGEFGLPNDGELPLATRRDVYRGWFSCARRTGAAGMAPWLFAYDARPDTWDRYTSYFRDGTAPADAANRYADVVLGASAD